MKCCEKWKLVKELEVPIKVKPENIKHCLTCGTELESEYKHKNYGYTIEKNKDGWSAKPIKPKRELPEKFSNIEKDLIGDRLIAPIVGKIEEILDYLK